MKRLIAIFLFLALVAGIGGVTAGDLKEPSLKMAVVRIGDYRDLTWYRNAKLGAAPFVNPGSLKHTAVAYKYDVTSFYKTSEWAKVSPLIKMGIVGIAIKSTGAYKVVSSKDTDWGKFVGRKVNLSEEVISELFGVHVVFVSNSKELLGQAPIGRVVSWNAVLPPDLPDFDPLGPK